MLIGTVEKVAARADAERAVEHLRVRINAENLQHQFYSVTIGAVIDRYVKEEMPNVREDAAKSYRGILEKWIRPRWGTHALQSVKTMAVESWIKSIPRSPNTRGHIRNMMHLLFNCVVRWELVDRNPIDLVRQSSKRTKIPRVLTPEEFKKLLNQLAEPYRMMVLVAGCLGLRISEILAFDGATLTGRISSCWFSEAWSMARRMTPKQKRLKHCCPSTRTWPRPS